MPSQVDVTQSTQGFTIAQPGLYVFQTFPEAGLVTNEYCDSLTGDFPDKTRAMNTLENIGDLAGKLNLPNPDQIGFVVRNLEQAIALYTPLFGPFTTADFSGYKVSYRGAPPSEFDMKFAFGRIGDLEIELIEWVSGDTPHRDFIRNGHEGMHHLRFQVDHVETWIERLKAHGYEVVWYNRAAPDYAFAYCERAGDPLLIEVVEYPSGDPEAV